MSVKNIFCLGLILSVALVSQLPGQDIHQAVKEGKLEAVKKMLEEDRDLVNAVDSDAKTPLHLAAEYGHIHIVELLLVKGADINAKSGFKRTPLHFAASSGHDEIVKLLIERGARINEIDSFMLAPIFRAAYKGHRNIVEMLLATGINTNMTEKNGVSLLHAAALAGNPELVEMLLDKGIDRNVPNIYGKTPLHFAASRGHKAVVRLLLDQEADINLKSLDGRTPLHTAVDCGQPEIVELLKARGADTSPREFAVPEGRYFGQEPPGLEPKIFAPAIISTDGYEFAITFSPDGKELYFTRREGEKNYPTNYLMVCRCENNRWTEPEIASFSGKYFDFESHISPDGQKFYFGSLRPRPQGMQAEGGIWFLEKTDHGWGEPKFLDAPINNGFAMYVTSAKNGNLYYTGADGLYCSFYRNGKYSEPEKLKDENDEYFSGAHPFIAPDESYLIFDSDPGLVISFRKEDGTWTKIKEMGIIPNMCPSVSPDGKYLFFARHGNIFWVDAKIIEDLKPKELK
jgi:ankyrin repeat protein/Tol biopolymer transport system component